uniref:SFRICE_023084 n=1 Tax=Spodoptera frugiperda TaxID=7108 RepID=A0A2H1V7H6_SPOFR
MGLDEKRQTNRRIIGKLSAPPMDTCNAKGFTVALPGLRSFLRQISWEILPTTAHEPSLDPYVIFKEMSCQNKYTAVFEKGVRFFSRVLNRLMTSPALSEARIRIETESLLHVQNYKQADVTSSTITRDTLSELIMTFMGK